MTSPTELIVRIADGGAAGTVTALVYAAADPPLGATLMLAHGAGANQHSPFMTACAQALAALGIDAVTFNFMYTEQRRRLPDRRVALESCYRAALEAVRNRVASAGRFLFIGGKSMGGRIATQVAADDRELPVAGLVLLGYPLHPPGRPAERRDAHLRAVGRPVLFVQGARDAFGTPAELSPVLTALHPPATLHVVENGDHSFKVARAGAAGQAAVLDEVYRAVGRWIRGVVVSTSGVR